MFYRPRFQVVIWPDNLPVTLSFTVIASRKLSSMTSSPPVPFLEVPQVVAHHLVLEISVGFGWVSGSDGQGTGLVS